MKYRCTFLLLWSALCLLAAGCSTVPKTPLIDAVSKGQSQTVHKLVTDGSKIDEVDRYGLTPLMHAIWNGQTETALTLMDMGADVNIADLQGWTALMYAAGYGSFEAADMLIKKGAHVNAKTKYGDTPLHYAVRNRDFRMTKRLADSGADLNLQNNSGATALHQAAQNHYRKKETAVQMIDDLLSRNPDLNVKDASQWTALRYAIYYKNVEIAAAIRKKTAFAEDIGALSLDEALKSPSYYVPEKEMYTVPGDVEKVFKTAVVDCNLLVIPTKAGLLFATGPLGYAIGMGIDKLTIKKKFVSCMEQMGFNCVNKCVD